MHIFNVVFCISICFSVFNFNKKKHILYIFLLNKKMMMATSYNKCSCQIPLNYNEIHVYQCSLCVAEPLFQNVVDYQNHLKYFHEKLNVNVWKTCVKCQSNNYGYCILKKAEQIVYDHSNNNNNHSNYFSNQNQNHENNHILISSPNINNGHKFSSLNESPPLFMDSFPVLPSTLLSGSIMLTPVKQVPVSTNTSSVTRVSNKRTIDDDQVVVSTNTPMTRVSNKRTIDDDLPLSLVKRRLNFTIVSQIDQLLDKFPKICGVDNIFSIQDVEFMNDCLNTNKNIANFLQNPHSVTSFNAFLNDEAVNPPGLIDKLKYVCKSQKFSLQQIKCMFQDCKEIIEEYECTGKFNEHLKSFYLKHDVSNTDEVFNAHRNQFVICFFASTYCFLSNKQDESIFKDIIELSQEMLL